MKISWGVGGHPIFDPKSKNEDKLGGRSHPTLDPQIKNYKDKLGLGRSSDPCPQMPNTKHLMSCGGVLQPISSEKNLSENTGNKAE